ncbi:MAG: hypothetical protein D0433_06135 [Candidatus Thermochlorobacter aerophilum]|uniref:Uncharacterized protein n=1 Tax=Candidatus Thermochlorobacter aerophilus TaxID=1868324 RepID=A0A395M1M1_9BACT|nr:MAG: hypothetical protein D0433_06135 [Candidatus Thermochlorobacter aerophilum]
MAFFVAFLTCKGHFQGTGIHSGLTDAVVRGIALWIDCCGLIAFRIVVRIVGTGHHAGHAARITGFACAGIVAKPLAFSRFSTSCFLRRIQRRGRLRLCHWHRGWVGSGLIGQAVGLAPS